MDNFDGLGCVTFKLRNRVKQTTFGNGCEFETNMKFNTVVIITKGLYELIVHVLAQICVKFQFSYLNEFLLLAM